MIWRRWRAPAAVVILILLGAAVIALLQGSPVNGPLDPRDTGPFGAHALAALLQARGQQVIRVSTVDAAMSAGAKGPATTLVITSPQLLDRSQRRVLARARSDLLIVGPGLGGLRLLAPGVERAGTAPVVRRPPVCGLPGARLAGDADMGGDMLRSALYGSWRAVYGSWHCYPAGVPAGAPAAAPTSPAAASTSPSAGASTGPSAGASTGPSAGASTGPSAGASTGPSAGASEGPAAGPSAGAQVASPISSQTRLSAAQADQMPAFLVRYPVNGRTITVLGTGLPLTNDRLDRDGNAALAMNLLNTSRVVWLVPENVVSAGGRSRSLESLYPRGAQLVAVEIGLAVLLTALWRMRRFGPLIPEPLPVVVRASETVEGHGRLYQSRHARDRAAAALRAATLTRIALRLGLPRDVPPDVTCQELASRTGRSPDEIRALLYGPVPQDDAALVTLATNLDTLEGQVLAP